MWAAVVDAGLGSVTFAWAGSTTPGERHYYAVRGETFLPAIKSNWLWSSGLAILVFGIVRNLPFTAFAWMRPMLSQNDLIFSAQESIEELTVYRLGDRISADQLLSVDYRSYRMR